jgi:hypothetical protein
MYPACNTHSAHDPHYQVATPTCSHPEEVVFSVHARMRIQVFSCCSAASPATHIRANGQHASTLITDAPTSTDPTHILDPTVHSTRPEPRQVHKHELVHLQTRHKDETLVVYFQQEPPSTPTARFCTSVDGSGSQCRGDGSVPFPARVQC